MEFKEKVYSKLEEMNKSLTKELDDFSLFEKEIKGYLTSS